MILCAGVMVFAVKRPLAQSLPDPVLTIRRLNTNQVQLTIANGVSTANYQIHQRRFLDPAYPWSPPLIGLQGQTNFTANIGSETMVFFGASPGLDWDQDGVPNGQDGNPISPNVGLLSITIDSPAAGSTLR
jgi:hypothetical protein